MSSSASSPAQLTVTAVVYPNSGVAPSAGVQNALQQILALPLSQQQGDYREESGAEMDLWTATSLNMENIQDYNLEDQQINAKNSSGWTPLMYAAYLGHRELCQLLILRGADVEASNERSQTAVMLAASCGAIDVIRILLDFGANCNRRDQFGRSSLHYAVKYYHTTVVQLLLENGADPNLSDCNESTPVLAACENGDERILGHLLGQKGDPNRCNKQGQNAFTVNADEKIQAVLKKYKREESELDKVLQQLELQKYARNFSQRGIKTVEALLKLSEKELDEMGIQLVGPKRKIANFIRERGAAAGAPPSQNPLSAAPSQQQLQQRIEELNKLCADQRNEIQEQRKINAQRSPKLRRTAAVQLVPVARHVEARWRN